MFSFFLQRQVGFWKSDSISDHGEYLWFYTLWVLLVFIIDGTSCMQHQYELLHVSICAWIGQSPEDKFAYLMILPLK